MTRKYTVSSLNTSEDERLRCVLEHFHENKAFLFLPKEKQTPAVLEQLKERYRRYRHAWRAAPEEMIRRGQQTGAAPRLDYPPMCVDIEIASICNLACPFCFRQHTATPDKLMDRELFHQVIDQCAALDVPSVKLNWRGEPLMHPALPEFVEYAKRKGILEVMINTNAVDLTRDRAKDLVEAGLDLIIYSFDGGTAATYERMRPGRFKPNRFEQVYENIKTLTAVREAAGAFFPRSRIQMIITDATAGEVEQFQQLFTGVVDDVSTKAYSERGGASTHFAPTLLAAIESHFAQRRDSYPDFTLDKEKIWLGLGNTVSYAVGRLACQQIFQRLIVTYDGRVHMCCYDWAGEHTIGFLTEAAFSRGRRDIEEVMRKTEEKAKGYDMLGPLSVPVASYEAEHRVSDLASLWQSPHLQEIRELHVTGRMEEIAVCRRCTFRDTYLWEEIPSVA